MHRGPSLGTAIGVVAYDRDTHALVLGEFALIRQVSERDWMQADPFMTAPIGSNSGDADSFVEIRGHYRGRLHQDKDIDGLSLGHGSPRYASFKRRRPQDLIGGCPAGQAM